MLMGFRATFFSLCFLVSVCFFICKWHGRSFLPGRNRETTSHQHKSHHVMTIKICHFMCVFAFVFYHSLLVDLSYIILFFPPKLFLFVCVCQIKQTARQPRQPTGYGHYFTSSITWSLFHHAYSSSSAGLTSKALLD